jgi:hypothetical protein
MSELRKEVCKMRKKKINAKQDKRVCEQNQNITKQYAVSYAILAYNHLHPKADATEFACNMIEIMRAMKPRFAVKEADKILQGKEYNGKHSNE